MNTIYKPQNIGKGCQEKEKSGRILTGGSKVTLMSGEGTQAAVAHLRKHLSDRTGTEGWHKKAPESLARLEQQGWDHSLHSQPASHVCRKQPASAAALSGSLCKLLASRSKT